jgi:hypothetical protein
MTPSDLIAMLHEAMHELDVLGSYLDDPDIEWPTVGLKTTAKAHKKLAGQIKALLATDLEDQDLRQENLALRAALRSKQNDENWREVFLASEIERGRLQRVIRQMQATAVAEGK